MGDLSVSRLNNKSIWILALMMNMTVHSANSPILQDTCNCYCCLASSSLLSSCLPNSTDVTSLPLVGSTIIYGPSFALSCNAMSCYSYYPTQCPYPKSVMGVPPAVSGGVAPAVDVGVIAGCGNCPMGLDGRSRANSTLPTPLLDLPSGAIGAVTAFPSPSMTTDSAATFTSGSGGPVSANFSHHDTPSHFWTWIPVAFGLVSLITAVVSLILDEYCVS